MSEATTRKRDDGKLRELLESGHFVDPRQLEGVSRPTIELREVDGETVQVRHGMRHYFWPYFAWLKLQPEASNISYISLFEQMEREHALFYGLESYLVWRPDRCPILLGWVEQKDVSDLLAEIGHLEEMRERLYIRLRALGAPHESVEIGIAIVSSAFDAGDLEGFVDLDAIELVGRSGLGELGRRLDDVVASMPRHVGSIEQVLAATGVMLDHAFPSQPLTELPAEFFDSAAARAA